MIWQQQQLKMSRKHDNQRRCPGLSVLGYYGVKVASCRQPMCEWMLLMRSKRQQQKNKQTTIIIKIIKTAKKRSYKINIISAIIAIINGKRQENKSYGKACVSVFLFGRILLSFFVVVVVILFLGLLLLCWWGEIIKMLLYYGSCGPCSVDL